MSYRTWLRPVVAAVALAAAAGGDHLRAGDDRGDPEATAADVLFVRRIRPLLAEKCGACHGDPEAAEGGLSLASPEAVAAGGDSGSPALVPGEPDASPVVLAVGRRHDDWSAMPPKESEQLSDREIGWLREWIAAGAPWPDDERAAAIAKSHEEAWSAEDGVTVATAGGLSEEWTNRRYRPESLWGYRPVLKPQPPARPTRTMEIDAFIDAALPAGLAPAPPADRRTLLRRATFDLTGLPPTPEDLADFLGDPRPDDVAFAAVVDRLLASPHYGERMAQHWLDVVRYADSSGFSNDYARGNAWRYRDYVVRSFGADKPYDRFVREQIAGDEIAPDDPEAIVATGFLRMGPWELTTMEVPRVARQRFLDDVTNSVGETFLAHSLQCARCHDHKFDPVPTRDYYAIQAVFATTQLAEREAAFLEGENTAGFAERSYLERSRADHEAVLARLDAAMLAAAETWFTERHLDATEWHAAVEAARRTETREIFDAARRALLERGVAEDRFPPPYLGLSTAEIGLQRVAGKAIERLAWELDAYEPVAFAVYDGLTPRMTSVRRPLRMPASRLTSGDLDASCILAGGDPFSPAEPVKPGVLSAVPGAEAVVIPADVEGRRRAFADWVAAADNPLTTRTIVNRVWMWHFGTPLAGNPNNFGSTGKRPTHPDLLDWLAATFVEDGWSFKRLHRRIMLSAAYRRSSRHPEPARLAELDPQGTSRAVFSPRRLSAEELRDAMLAASGELNPAVGGVPSRPEINLEAALQPRQVMGTFASAWWCHPQPAGRHRRSLYTLRLRGLADPGLEVFNAPAPDFSCERREASTVTPQVFALFNSRASHGRALALAARGLAETGADGADGETAAVVRCFELALGRRPTAAEVTDCARHWREMTDVQARVVPGPQRPPLEVDREAVEESTGEAFTFTESLHAHAEFVPDLEPAACDARTRGLADVCLVLFNTNEFAYVD